jgi:hypothetical protein
VRLPLVPIRSGSTLIECRTNELVSAAAAAVPAVSDCVVSADATQEEEDEGLRNAPLSLSPYISLSPLYPTCCDWRRSLRKEKWALLGDWVDKVTFKRLRDSRTLQRCKLAFVPSKFNFLLQYFLRSTKNRTFFPFPLSLKNNGESFWRRAICQPPPS